MIRNGSSTEWIPMWCPMQQHRFYISKTPTGAKKKLSKDTELHNAFYLADRLKKTINEVMNMTMDEFQYWMAYFKLEERKQKQNVSRYGKK